MTSRRAFFNGARAARLLAAMRRNGGSAALVIVGGLLLPPCVVPAARAVTRVNHTHHATAPSAGKAQAHVVHDEDLRSSHSPGKSSRGKARHEAEPPSHAAHSAASRKGGESSAHARNSEDSRHNAKTPAKAQSKSRSGRKYHEEEPVDDPMPVRRAGTRHNEHDLPRVTPRGKKYEPEIEAASTRRTPAPIPHYAAPTHSTARYSSPRETEADTVAEEREPAPIPAAPAVLPTRTGTPGNVARNLARRSGQGHNAPAASANPTPATQNPTGVSQPDDDEKLPMNSLLVNPANSTNSASQPLSPAARRQAAAVAALARPTVSAPSTPPTPSNSAAVEGFGGEVDFHSPTTLPTSRALAVAPVAPPRGTPAEQALELRAAAEVASKPMFVPLYNRDGKLLVPPPLKGSRDILVHQNQMADDAGLTRIQDDADLARLRRAHLLVDLEDTASLRINEGLPENRRSARPWAVKFANDIANAFYSRFGDPLQVNSAVRTVAYQLRLQRTNGNAAAVDGEGASPHLTGQAIDFGKRGMSMAQIAWMRSYLLPLIEAGKIDVEEEFQQACFHISIYASYVPVHKRAPARTELAQAPRPTHARIPATDDNEDMR